MSHDNEVKNYHALSSQKINEPIPPIGKQLDASYNQAIDDAINDVRKSLAWLHQEEIEQVVSNLTKLKKP